MNSLLWSAYVNLLAAGIAAATARTTISHSVCQDSAAQALAVTEMTTANATCATEAAKAVPLRASWYNPNSPYQTYVHL